MGSQAFYTSKIFWGGIAAIISGVAQMLTSGVIDMASITSIIGGIIALWGGTVATAPLGLKTVKPTYK